MSEYLKIAESHPELVVLGLMLFCVMGVLEFALWALVYRKSGGYSMTDEQDAETSAVAKLAHLHPDEFILFTAAEAQALRKVAIWYQRLEGAVALGGVLGEVLKWAIVIGAGIAAAKAGLLGWLGIGGTGL